MLRQLTSVVMLAVRSVLPISLAFATFRHRDEEDDLHEERRTLERYEDKPMNTTEGTEMEDHGTRPVHGRDRVDLEMDDDYFEPTVLEGSPGQHIRLVVVNEGSGRHNFHIDGVDGGEIDRDVMPGGRRRWRSPSPAPTPSSSAASTTTT